MGADRSTWQFPKNEANKLVGWRSNGKGLENKNAADVVGDVIGDILDNLGVVTVGDHEASTFIRRNTGNTDYEALTASEVVTALNVKALNADGGFTFQTTATTQDWDGPFGGTWRASTMFASTGSATHSGSLATATFKRVASGSGTNGPGSADLALFVSSEKTDWKTSTVQGEIDGISLALRQGENGDAGAILINGKKVAGDGAYGMTGVEGALYSTDGTSDVTGHHFGVKFTAGSILNAGPSDVRDGGVGFNAGALVGDVDGESPKTAFLARGDGSGGKWLRVLVASSSNSETDNYFQITGGSDGETPTMRFGKPASGSVTVRNSSGAFQVLDHSGDPILNLIESTKQATFFGSAKIGGNSAPAVQVIAGGNATATWTSIAAQSTQAQNATVTGAATGDLVLITPNNTFANGALGVTGRITAANTLTINLTNPTAGAINPGEQTFRYLVIRIS